MGKPKWKEPKSVPAVIRDAQNKPAFDFDCLSQIEGVDPLVPLFEDFPFEDVLRHLDGEPERETHDFAGMGRVLGELLRWLTEGRDVKRTEFRVLWLLAALAPHLLSPQQRTALLKSRNAQVLWARRKALKR